MDTGEWEQLVEGAEWEAWQHVLTDLSDEDRAAALKWYRRKGRALARKVADSDWRPHSRFVQLQLALGLAETAEEASKNCQWGRRFTWTDELDAMRLCADLLVSRGTAWAGEFVALSTTVTLRGESRRGVEEITSLASAAIEAFALPSPTHETYVRGWTSLIGHAHMKTRHQNNPRWRPLTLLTVDESGAHAAYQLGPEASLDACLRGTRDLTTMLTSALEVPNALAEWSDVKGERWDLPATLRALLADGTLDREPVLEHALGALSRDDRPGTQGVIGQIIVGLDLTSAETREHVALILHVLPTVSGSVTRLLLALALDADLDDDDLTEIGAVILARKEKAQKTTLLNHLTSSTSGARETLLLMASDSEDATLAAKARELLGDDLPLADSAPVASTSTWSRPTDPFRSGNFVGYAADAAGLDQARSDEETWSRITTDAAYLDAVVRFGRRDLEGLRAAALAGGNPESWAATRVRYLVHQWASTGEAHRSYRIPGTVITYSTGKEPVETTHLYDRTPPGFDIVTDRLTEETLRRLGSFEELLSTPSRVDGTVTVADLAARVHRAGRAGRFRSRTACVGYGPYDLVQALLRLDLSTGDITPFKGVMMPPISGSGPDGVDVIRGWIAAGGFPSRQLDHDGTRPRMQGVTLPLPASLASLDGLKELCLPIGHGDGWQRAALWLHGASGVLGVMPFAADTYAVMNAQRHDQDSVFQTASLPVLAWSAGPMGAATHHHLARLLVHPRADSRLLAAKYTAVLAEQGRIDADLLREWSLVLFEAKELSLARAAHGWEQLATTAGLGVIWPAWIAVLAAACASARKPAGLADLLRATRDHVAVAAPHADRSEGEVLPVSVRALAAEKGKGKAVIEAKALTHELAATVTARADAP